MKKKVISFALATAMVGTLLTGCGSTSTSSTAAATSATTTSAAASAAAASTGAATGAEDNIVRIGVVCTLTGGNAIYGEGAQNAITMASDEINASDSKIKIKIVNNGKGVDDAGDSKQAVNAYNS